MIWLKFALGGLIIAFCTLIGWLASGKFRARKSFYSQLNALNEKYLAELKYRRKPLAQFLAEFQFKGDFEGLMREYAESRTVKAEFSYLTEGEREFVREYLSMLGKGDSHSQSGYFSAQADLIAEKKETSEKEAKTHGELYLKLGLLSGLAVVILIV